MSGWVCDCEGDFGTAETSVDFDGMRGTRRAGRWVDLLAWNRFYTPSEPMRGSLRPRRSKRNSHHASTNGRTDQGRRTELSSAHPSRNTELVAGATAFRRPNRATFSYDGKAADLVTLLRGRQAATGRDILTARARAGAAPLTRDAVSAVPPDPGEERHVSVVFHHYVFTERVVPSGWYAPRHQSAEDSRVGQAYVWRAGKAARARDRSTLLYASA